MNDSLHHDSAAPLHRRSLPWLAFAGGLALAVLFVALDPPRHDDALHDREGSVSAPRAARTEAVPIEAQDAGTDRQRPEPAEDFGAAVAAYER